MVALASRLNKREQLWSDSDLGGHPLQTQEFMRAGMVAVKEWMKLGAAGESWYAMRFLGLKHHNVGNWCIYKTF